MPRFTDPDEARQFLNSISDHPDRPGDTSKLNPQFALNMANSIDQARAAGLPVRLLSGQREGGVTNSAYDRGGYSSHIYGLASDVEGIGGAGSKTAQQWGQIAQQNGLSNPYLGTSREGKEWNHWQVGPKLENDPALLGKLRAAHASGDTGAMWAAYGGSTPPATATAYNEPAITLKSPALSAINDATTPPAGSTPDSTPYKVAGPMQPPPNQSHEQFIRNYAQSIGLNPNLAAGIAGVEGLHAWSPSNPNAGSLVDRTNGTPWSFGDFQLNTRNGMGVDALKAGIDPRDPNQWQAADKFALDQMKSGGVKPWSGDPVAAAYLKTGAAPAGTTTLNQTATTPAEAPGPMDPSAQAGGPGAVLGTAGSTVNPQPPDATAAAPTQNVGDWIKGLATRPPDTTDANGKAVPGQSPLEKLAGAAGGVAPKPAAAPAAAASQPMLPTQVVNPTAQLAGPSQQLLTAAIAAGAKPLSWSNRPYGYGIAGTTLNATGYNGNV